MTHMKNYNFIVVYSLKINYRAKFSNNGYWKEEEGVY
jgi:hypothetical protein